MRYTTLFLLIIFFFTSCKKENSEQGGSGGTNQEIYPLAQSNIWNYRRIETSQQDTSFYSNWIDGDTMVGSEKWYREFFIDSSNYDYTRNKSDGFHFYHANVGIDDLAYKFPAQIGDHYNSLYYPDSIVVQNIDTLIMVPAGYFSCYEYKSFTGSTYYSLLYVSPGTGFIKGLNYTNGSLSSMNELISFSLH